LAPFRSAIIAVRWGTVAIGLVLAAGDLQNDHLASAAWAVVVIAYAAFRTLRPIRITDDLSGVVAVFVEVALHSIAVTSPSGRWTSLAIGSPTR
jgi:hypothetical protein